MMVLFGHERPFSVEIIKIPFLVLKFDFEIRIGVEALGPGSIFRGIKLQNHPRIIKFYPDLPLRGS